MLPPRWLACMLVGDVSCLSDVPFTQTHLTGDISFLCLGRAVATRTFRFHLVGLFRVRRRTTLAKTTAMTWSSLGVLLIGRPCSPSTVAATSPQFQECTIRSAAYLTRTASCATFRPMVLVAAVGASPTADAGGSETVRMASPTGTTTATASWDLAASVLHWMLTSRIRLAYTPHPSTCVP